MNTEKLICALMLTDRSSPAVRRALLNEAKRQLAAAKRTRAEAERRGPVRRVADRAGRYV
jgi:hypothetical protein